MLEKDVPLDDKRLSDLFDEYSIKSVTKEETINNVKLRLRTFQMQIPI